MAPIGDTGLPINPLGDANPFKVQVASIPFAGGEVKYLSEGDEPVVSKENKVAFIKGGQVWTVQLDSTTAAKNLFTTRGTVDDLQWSPDGATLLFVSNRVGHSIIGTIKNGDTEVKWIAPAFSRDGSPQWSPDGNKIVFIRRPVNGGVPDSILVRKHIPWNIYTADISTKQSNTVMESACYLAWFFSNNTWQCKFALGYK